VKGVIYLGVPFWEAVLISRYPMLLVGAVVVAACLRYNLPPLSLYCNVARDVLVDASLENNSPLLNLHQ
jgi:hypothetical protein